MKFAHLLQSTNNHSTLGSLCTFMCVHTFRSWSSELGIARLGPTGARNFLIRSLPLATCYSTLNSHTKSIHYVHTYGRTSALVLCSVRLQPLAAGSDGRLLENFRQSVRDPPAEHTEDAVRSTSRRQHRAARGMREANATDTDKEWAERQRRRRIGTWTGCIELNRG